MTDLDCALVVGHRKSARGASANGITEWTFWSEHAYHLAGLLGERGVTAKVVFRDDDRLGYQNLPGQVLALRPRCVVPLHLNSVARDDVSGTEVLVAAGDAEDLRLGNLLLEAMVSVMGLPNRGIRHITQGRNGAPLLFGLWTVPAGLIEPCFISNPRDAAILRARIWELLVAMADAVATFLDGGGVS